MRILLLAALLAAPAAALAQPTPHTAALFQLRDAWVRQEMLALNCRDDDEITRNFLRDQHDQSLALARAMVAAEDRKIFDQLEAAQMVFPDTFSVLDRARFCAEGLDILTVHDNYAGIVLDRDTARILSAPDGQ